MLPAWFEGTYLAAWFPPALGLNGSTNEIAVDNGSNESTGKSRKNAIPLRQELCLQSALMDWLNYI